MAHRTSETPKPKISPEFAGRLARLGPDALTRAIVLLDTGSAPTVASGRPSKATRRAIVEAIRTAAAPALAEVDRLLEGSGGRRLSPGPDLFGSVPVEAPASVLMVLAESKHIRALLEDQPISLMHDPNR